MRLLIAGGGTGGHLFPGIAIAQRWRARYPHAPILFVGTRAGLEAHLVPKAGFELAVLPVRGLRGLSWRRTLGGLGRLPRAGVAAWRVVSQFAPEVAVSVGGYAAGPAIAAAQAQRLPTVVLEQNAVAGWTNRLLAVACTLALSPSQVPGLPPRRTRVLGNPVRDVFASVRSAGYLPAQPLRLLVLGGSQGARAINSAVLAALPLWHARGLRVQLTHQAGRLDLERVNAGYLAAVREGWVHAPAVHAFIEDMAQAYAQADLVLCRAGAMTLSELTVCGRPSLLVPFPAASGDHQTANARALAAAGAALHLPQTELTGSALASLVAELDADRPRLLAMAQSARGQGRPQALEEIVDAISAVARGV